MRAATRTPRLPIFRLGLLLAIGAVAYAAFRFYIGLGESYANMSGDAPAGEDQGAGAFIRGLLSGGAGAIPIALLCLGLALMLIGLARPFLSRR
jgi:hypothetical protein